MPSQHIDSHHIDGTALLRFGIILILLPLPMSAVAQASGVFHLVKGQVIIVEKGGLESDEGRQAQVGDTVSEGTTVLAGEESRAAIQMIDGNIVNISPSTKMVFTTYQNDRAKKKVRLDVLKGKVRATVKQKYEGTNSSFFEVRTKTAVCGVRGTDFVVSYNPTTNISSVVTFEGLVKVSNLNAVGKILSSVMLPAGVGAHDSGGKILKQSLDEATLKSLDSNSTATPIDSERREFKVEPPNTKIEDHKDTNQSAPEREPAGSSFPGTSMISKEDLVPTPSSATFPAASALSQAQQMTTGAQLQQLQRVEQVIQQHQRTRVKISVQIK